MNTVHDPVGENRPLQDMYYNTQSAEPVTVMAAVLLGIANSSGFKYSDNSKLLIVTKYTEYYTMSNPFIF